MMRLDSSEIRLQDLSNEYSWASIHLRSKEVRSNEVSAARKVRNGMNNSVCPSVSAERMFQNGMISSICNSFAAAVRKVANGMSSSVYSANDVMVESNILSIVPEN